MATGLKWIQEICLKTIVLEMVALLTDCLFEINLRLWMLNHSRYINDHG